MRYTLLTESETPLAQDGTYRDATISGSITLPGLCPPESPEITKTFNFLKNKFTEV